MEPVLQVSKFDWKAVSKKAAAAFSNDGKGDFKISKTSIPNTQKFDFQIMENRDSKIPEMRFQIFCFGFRNLLPRAPGFRSGAALLVRHTPPHLRAEKKIHMPPMDAVGWHHIVVLNLPWRQYVVLKNSKFLNLGHQKTIKMIGWFDAVLTVLHGAISRSVRKKPNSLFQEC